MKQRGGVALLSFHNSFCRKHICMLLSTILDVGPLKSFGSTLPCINNILRLPSLLNSTCQSFQENMDAVHNVIGIQVVAHNFCSQWGNGIICSHDSGDFIFPRKRTNNTNQVINDKQVRSYWIRGQRQVMLYRTAHNIEAHADPLT